jgi:hypothetical protein
MSRKLVLPVVFALTTMVFPPPAVAGDPKPEQVARVAASDFSKALKAKDLEGALKVVAVPFMKDNGQIVNDQDELRKYLKEAIAAIKDPSTAPVEIIDVVPYAKARDKANQDDRKASDQVVSKNDLVVFVGREKKRIFSVLVRVREGKAKVVGLGGPGAP